MNSLQKTFARLWSTLLIRPLSSSLMSIQLLPATLYSNRKNPERVQLLSTPLPTVIHEQVSPDPKEAKVLCGKSLCGKSLYCLIASIVAVLLLVFFSVGIAAELRYQPSRVGTTIFPFAASGPSTPLSYRIPLLLSIGLDRADPDVLLAFAEGRPSVLNDSGPKLLTYTRSTNNGASWSQLEVIHEDPSHDPSYDGANLGSVVWDPISDAVFLQVRREAVVRASRSLHILFSLCVCFPLSPLC